MVKLASGHGSDRRYYYDDKIAQCTCKECKPFQMCWPREMFGVGQSDNLRGCSMWTLLCTQRIKKEKRIQYPEWACYMSWKKTILGEGLKAPKTKKYRNQEETMENDEIFQKQFLPLFDKLDKNEENEYIDPVFNIKNGWYIDQVMGPPLEKVKKGRPLYSMSVDRIDPTLSHADLSNIQIVSWRYNDLKGTSTKKEREVIGNHAANFIY